MNFSAVILAGGKSSRMGRDKAWLPVDGKLLLARQIELAREIGAREVFISGRADADYSAFGCRVLKDKFSDAGPLAGIERALAETSLPLVLVLAVDLANMTAEMLRALAKHYSQNVGVIPRFNQHLEPLAAFYPKAAEILAASRLERGSLAAKDFAADCVQAGLARFIDLPTSDATVFANWNMPHDVAV